MKHKFTTAALALLALSGLKSPPATAFAQGTAFTYQGQLQNGGALVSGPYDMTFTLFNINTGGTVVGGPLTNTAVAVSNGLFTTSMDFGVGLLDGGDRWLEIAVRPSGGGAFSTLAPRQELTPVPYSVVAENLAQVVQYNTLGPGEFVTVGGGDFNTVSNDFSTLGGGAYNTAGGIESTVGGGFGNIANGDNSIVGGGVNNAIQPAAAASTIAGGNNNTIQSGASSAVVGGGNNNTIGTNAYYATIAGGYFNSIQTNAYESTIGGGRGNTIQTNTTDSTIGGGFANTIQANENDSTIGGGVGNVIQSADSTLGGGYFNTIQAGAYNATIGGGTGNSIQTNGFGATIGGGGGNIANGFEATVPGGDNNLASGSYSFAAGYQARAVNASAFVWSDSESAPFSSTSDDQFAVRASGGVFLEANLQVGAGGGDYRQLSLGGGNSTGFLYGSYPKWGDGIHLGYNYYADAGGFGHIPNAGGATSRLTVSYGSIGMYVGAVNAAPSSQMLVATASGVTVYGTFNNNSDRNSKEDFAPVSSAQMLQKVGQLPITEWSY